MLIIGLGNPGEKYEKNRHNVGRMFVEWLSSHIAQEEMPWKKDSSGSFFYCKSNEKNILVYPNNFMNISGIAAGRSVKQFGIKIEKEFFVAHDDLDIPLGSFKIDFAKGPKLHNGIDSVEEHLHTKDFYRTRIGVDARDPQNRTPGEAYVLQNFTDEEIKTITELFPQIARRLEELSK